MEIHLNEQSFRNSGHHLGIGGDGIENSRRAHLQPTDRLDEGLCEPERWQTWGGSKRLLRIHSAVSLWLNDDLAVSLSSISKLRDMMLQ